MHTGALDPVVGKDVERFEMTLLGAGCQIFGVFRKCLPHFTSTFSNCEWGKCGLVTMTEGNEQLQGLWWISLVNRSNLCFNWKQQRHRCGTTLAGALLSRMYPPSCDTKPQCAKVSIDRLWVGKIGCLLAPWCFSYCKVQRGQNHASNYTLPLYFQIYSKPSKSLCYYPW